MLALHFQVFVENEYSQHDANGEREKKLCQKVIHLFFPVFCNKAEYYKNSVFPSMKINLN